MPIAQTVPIDQTVPIALRDPLGRKILIDLENHLDQKDQFGRTIRSVLHARKAQIALAGQIEGKDRLELIERKGHHALRELVEPKGLPVPRVRIEAKDHHEPTDRNETIDRPVLTDPLVRKVLTGQPPAIALLARTERVLRVENAESGTGIPIDDLVHPVPQLRRSLRVLAREFMTMMPSNLLTILRR